MEISELSLTNRIIKTWIQIPYPAVTICFGGSDNEKLTVYHSRLTAEANLRCKKGHCISIIVGYLKQLCMAHIWITPRGVRGKLCEFGMNHVKHVFGAVLLSLIQDHQASTQEYWTF